MKWIIETSEFEVGPLDSIDDVNKFVEENGFTVDDGWILHVGPQRRTENGVVTLEKFMVAKVVQKEKN